MKLNKIKLKNKYTYYKKNVYKNHNSNRYIKKIYKTKIKIETYKIHISLNYN